MAKTSRTQISQRNQYRLRVRFVSLCFLCVFVVILARLFILQVIEHPKLVHAVEEQTYRVVNIPAHRGDIRDRNGVVLATSVFRDTIYLDPRRFGKLEFEITRTLANALGQSRLDLVDKVGKSVTAVARRLPPERSREILAKVGELEPKPAYGAIFSRQESTRLYPKGALGANLVGFCVEEKDGSDDNGVAGLEKAYNDLLGGEDQKQRVLINRWGQAIEPFDEDIVLASYGNSVELTIDAKIQYFAETALAKRVAETGGKGGVCVVMDPRNGDLLAIASYPSFVPDDPRTRLPDYMRNRAFENWVEPGSVMKIFTYAIAGELGLFSPIEMVDCEGKSYRFTEGRVGRTITDFHGMGVVSFEKAFWESSNVAAVKLGLRIPDVDFYEKLALLQLTEKTGLNFPGETAGKMTYLPWQFMTRTSVPFGYEITANSVQMAACIASIANGGVKMAPRLVRRLVSPRGETVEEFKPREEGRMFSEATAQLISEMMEGVVVEGTGKPAAVDGYRVAGKTGTTRKTDVLGDDRAYLASFAGFLPVSAPQMVIYCWIDEPQKATDSYTGGRAAAPIFSEVASQAVRILGIKPDKELAPGAVARVEPEPTPPPMHAEPVAVEAADLFENYDLQPQDDGKRMPDLLGMTKREVTQALAELARENPGLQMKPRFYGNGIVVRQDPPPMSALRGTGECTVQFGRPGDLQQFPSTSETELPEH